MMFVAAIAIGLLLGAAPAVIGIVFIIRAMAKRKKPQLLLFYFVVTIILNILLNTLAGKVAGCRGSGPMTGADDMKNCFYFYIFFGSSFGVSMLMGLLVLLIGRKSE